MITHVLKDGSKVESVSGKVISSIEFPVIYKILEGGDERGESLSSPEGSAGSGEGPEQLRFLPRHGSR